MKYVHVYAFFLMSVFYSSCGKKHATPPQDNFSREHNGLSQSQIKKLAASRVPMSMVRHIRQARNGDILIPASWGGVFRYDGKSFTNLTSSKIGSHRFWDVLEDRRGNLWFASTDFGVYKYDGKTFQHFTTREGLVNNDVMSIYEDKAGNIWFATGGGASRYDGKSFRNFTTKDGLSNNDLTTIMEDKTGKIWFGTRGDACYYDGEKFTVFKNRDGKPFYNVWTIIEDKAGNIWFGATIINDRRSNGKGGDTLFGEDGLWRYDGVTFTKVSQRRAYAIIEDKKGNIWTTGDINLDVWVISRYDAKFLYNKMPTVTEIKSGGRMDFLGILEANDGSFWFGSGGGVYHYDGKTFTDFKNKAGRTINDP